MEGKVIWITGLSGAGKSTLAHEVWERLRADGMHVALLDGDELREVFGSIEQKSQNHGREGRLALSRKYSSMCRLLATQGLTVVISTISLFHEIHQWNRANLPGYFEVYLAVPIDELRRRDSKGIYMAYDLGELTDVAGLDLPVDEPKAPDFRVDYRPEQSVTEIADELTKRAGLA